MAGGTISLGSQGYLVAQIVWSATSNGTAKNNSTVTASLQIRRSNNYTTTGTWGGSLQVGSKSESISYYGGVSSSWVTIKTITATIAHNSNGTGTCYIYGRVTGPSGTTMAGYALSSSKTVTLDTIPRGATITSAPNFTDEGNPVLKYSNPAGSSVDELVACISSDGSSDDLAAYRTISKTGTSYTFNLTDAERAKLQAACTTAKSRTVHFYVRTKIGSSTLYSSVEKTLTIANAAPTLSPTVKDTNATTKALTGDEAKFVKGHSNAAFTVGASALKKATIKSQKVTCGEKSSSSASGTLSAVESGTFAFSVTDSRGYTTTKKLTKTLIDYVELTCSLKASNPTADGDMAMKISGSYFNGSFGTTANTLTVQYRQSTDGGSTWGAWVAVTPTLSGNSYTADVELTGLDYQTAYTFQARAVDKLATVNTAKRTVRATPVFDWGEDSFTHNTNLYFGVNGAGQGAIYGLLPDGSGYVENLQPVNQNGHCVVGYGNYDRGEGNTHVYGTEVCLYTKEGVFINGNLLADQVVAEGTSGIWRYWKWASGLAVIHAVLGDGNGLNLTFSGQNSNGDYILTGSSFSYAAPFALFEGNGGFTSHVGDSNVIFDTPFYYQGNIYLRTVAKKAGTFTVYPTVTIIGRWK